MNNTERTFYNALEHIAGGIERQNEILKELTENIEMMRRVINDVSWYPADEREAPRILVDISGRINTD